MKKLLIVLVLIVSGCGYAAPDNTTGIIVTEIETSVSGSCWYYGKGNNTNMLTLVGYFQIKDTCGKFNVGDTIKLVK